jgi:transcriptional antiterminator RfaH
MNTESWFVCHTRSRCEKKFAGLMESESFEYYLPLLESIRKYGGRTRTFTKPLFPGYVFAKVPWDKKPRLYQQELLARVISVPDEALFLRQLEAVRTLMQSGSAVAVLPLLAKGRKVRITTGPLRGVDGYIHDTDSAKGIVVAIDVLQKGILIRVSPDHCEAQAAV